VVSRALTQVSDLLSGVHPYLEAVGRNLILRYRLWLLTTTIAFLCLAITASWFHFQGPYNYQGSVEMVQHCLWSSSLKPACSLDSPLPGSVTHRGVGSGAQGDDGWLGGHILFSKCTHLSIHSSLNASFHSQFNPPPIHLSTSPLIHLLILIYLSNHL